MKIRPLEAAFFQAGGRTDGQRDTDGRAKASSPFSRFYECT
jgi:hypothetical protein